ncbi:hypothetical protein DPEC_G00244530 [Dallia pectoralis]|uniref:Uncharacterized protein n=1 Tax=Dallia pectoralis TaxID=75939 RepID=A0ACC2FVJ3_DALPE|nr:hypothetical protein DPEC_G00244530 [Dallia pectoralis]
MQMLARARLIIVEWSGRDGGEAVDGGGLSGLAGKHNAGMKGPTSTRLGSHRVGAREIRSSAGPGSHGGGYGRNSARSRHLRSPQLIPPRSFQFTINQIMGRSQRKSHAML